MKKCLFLVLCLCMLCATLCAETLKDDIEKNLALLSSSEYYKRVKASQNLVAIGPPVLSHISFRFPQSDYLARRQMAYVLGQIGNGLAIKLLQNAFNDSDLGVRKAVAMAFLELSDKNPQVIKLVKRIRIKDKKIISERRKLLEILVAKEVEKQLRSLISKDGGFGFFQGQFVEVKKLGKSAVDPLLEIFKQSDYLFIDKKLYRDQDTSYKVRLLAGEAIAEFDPMLIGRRRSDVLSALRTLYNTGKDQQIKEIAAYSMYKLGDKNPLLSKIRTIEQQIIINRENSGEYYSSLAIIYLRINDNEKGLDYLQKAKNADPGSSLVHYNMSCAYACMNRIEDAVKALEQAVNLGYDDLEWIKKDGDLRNIRDHPRVKKLMEKLKKTKERQALGG